MQQLLYAADTLGGNGITIEFGHYRVVNQDIVALITGGEPHELSEDIKVET
jgi:hypothetical protein